MFGSVIMCACRYLLKWLHIVKEGLLFFLGLILYAFLKYEEGKGDLVLRKSLFKMLQNFLLQMHISTVLGRLMTLLTVH